MERNNRFILFFLYIDLEINLVSNKKKKKFLNDRNETLEREKKKKEKMAIIHGMTCEEITIATLNIE